MPCPRCWGAGKGLLRDCRLCDDLCYVTEPWVQCQVCFGSGRQGHLGDLSPDCSACRGVGYTKPGMGVGGLGMPGYGGMMQPMAPAGYPPAVGMAPGYAPSGYAPGYAPGYPAYPPHF